MKNLFATAILFALSLNIGMTSTNPVIDGDNERHSIKFKFNANYGDVVSVEFNKEQNALSFSTTKHMSFVQIMNEDGELEFQLPVFSNDVILDLDDFNSGKFQINLLLVNDEMISSTFEK